MLSSRASVSSVTLWKLLVKVLETLTCGNWVREGRASHQRAEFVFTSGVIGLKSWLVNRGHSCASWSSLAGLFADTGWTLMKGLWKLQDMATEWVYGGQDPMIPAATVRRARLRWALPSSLTLEGAYWLSARQQDLWALLSTDVWDAYRSCPSFKEIHSAILQATNRISMVCHLHQSFSIYVSITLCSLASQCCPSLGFLLLIV